MLIIWLRYLYGKKQQQIRRVNHLFQLCIFFFSSSPMATAVEKRPCAKCPKGTGVTTCDGCQKSFCIKHIVEHRQELAMKMDDLGQEHDTFRRDLNEKNNTHSLFSHIQQWEEKSIETIHMIADKARVHLRQLLEQTNNNLKRSMDEMTYDLQQHRESEDYTEIDLAQWSNKLADIRNSFEMSSTIQITKDDQMSNVIYPIRVVEKRTVSSTQTPLFNTDSTKSSELTKEVFIKGENAIHLSERGLLATMTNGAKMKQSIFGKHSYGSGVHRIHFRVESKGIEDFFFGIVTMSQILGSDIYSTSSANGWWGFQISVVNGINRKLYEQSVVQRGDMLTLTLDCNKKMIELENHRTQSTLQSSINVLRCPLPWKMIVSLSLPGDILRILQ